MLTTGTQVPPPPVQAAHVPQAAMVQQWPSTQWPVEQSPSIVQLFPGVTLQVPVASQLFWPLHESGSVLFLFETHDPSGAVQLWHVLQLAVPQQ
jgi:hypothetical protein